MGELAIAGSIVLNIVKISALVGKKYLWELTSL
jgi:hypothetical protein